jgi:hypothetical protein
MTQGEVARGTAPRSLRRSRATAESRDDFWLPASRWTRVRRSCISDVP